MSLFVINKIMNNVILESGQENKLSDAVADGLLLKQKRKKFNTILLIISVGLVLFNYYTWLNALSLSLSIISLAINIIFIIVGVRVVKTNKFYFRKVVKFIFFISIFLIILFWSFACCVAYREAYFISHFDYMGDVNAGGPAPEKISIVYCVKNIYK